MSEKNKTNLDPTPKTPDEDKTSRHFYYRYYKIEYLLFLVVFSSFLYGYYKQSEIYFRLVEEGKKRDSEFPDKIGLRKGHFGYLTVRIDFPLL